MSYNTMAKKGQRTNNDVKISTKNQRWSNIKNPGANSYGPKNQADHTPLVTPIVLLLNHTNMI
jgi:hypothetical protein